MASVNDTGDVRGAAARQWELLADADIDDRDRDAIEAFVRHRRVHGAKHGDYAVGTERSDLKELRLSAERADVALVDMGLDDLNRLLDTLTAEAPPKDDNGRTWKSQDYQGIEPGTNGSGYGVTTGIDAYTRALRPFFGWLDAHNDHGDFGWWEHVKTGNVDFPKPSERRFPTQAEIDAMKAEARANQAPRDVAMLAFFEDTAVRRTLGGQLRVGDVSFGGDRPAFTPNPEGVAQKDVAVKPYPMYDCVADLRTWVNHYHPDPDNDDAPLWTHEPAEYRRRRDPAFCHNHGCRTPVPDQPDECPHCGGDVHDDGAIRVSQIGRIVKKYGERAGIDGDEVELKPHAFRHAAVGRWKETGYDLTKIQRRTAWKDEAAAEMWARYGDPDDDVVDAGIDEIEGRTPRTDAGDDEPAEARERFDCGNCPATDITSDHCPECGSPVSPDAIQADMEESERDVEAMAETVRRVIEENPELLADD